MSETVSDAMGTRGRLIVAGNALRYLSQNAASARPEAHEEFPFATRLVGPFNVANCLTALGLGLVLGLDRERMLEALPRFRGVPGRMEAVEAGRISAFSWIRAYS